MQRAIQKVFGPLEMNCFLKDSSATPFSVLNQLLMLHRKSWEKLSAGWFSE